MKLHTGTKRTTRLIAMGSAIGLVLMLAVFFVLHLLQVVVFDYKVVLGAVVGYLVAVGNFLVMCLTIQAAAQIEDQKQMKARIQFSYNGRMFMQAAWVVLAFVLPCFNGVAGAVPLLFPSVVILLLRKSGKLVEPSQRKNTEEPQDSVEA